MDDNQQTPVTDDQDLAKVLADMHQQAADPEPAVEVTSETPVDTTAPISTPELQFEATPLEASEEAAPAVEPEIGTLPPVEAPGLAPVAEPETEAAPAIEPELPALEAPVVDGLAAAAPSASPELDSIKKEALEELRPLVDKLDLPADEKFDTLLLVIRSTDDKSLVDATFEAAKAITDDTKRAQALLDVIKEIDYFAGQK